MVKITGTECCFKCEPETPQNEPCKPKIELVSLTTYAPELLNCKAAVGMKIELHKCEGTCAASSDSATLLINGKPRKDPKKCTCCTGENGVMRPVFVSCFGKDVNIMVQTFSGCKCNACIDT